MFEVCEELRKSLYRILKQFVITVETGFHNRNCVFHFTMRVTGDHGFGFPKTIAMNFHLDEMEIAMQIRGKYDVSRFVRDWTDRIVRDVLMSFAGELAKE